MGLKILSYLLLLAITIGFLYERFRPVEIKNIREEAEDLYKRAMSLLDEIKEISDEKLSLAHQQDFKGYSEKKKEFRIKTKEAKFILRRVQFLRFKLKLLTLFKGGVMVSSLTLFSF